MRLPPDPRLGSLLALLLFAAAVGLGCGDPLPGTPCGADECSSFSRCDLATFTCIPPCGGDNTCGIDESTVCFRNRCYFTCEDDGDGNCPEERIHCVAGRCAECIADEECRDEDHPNGICEEDVCTDGCGSDEDCTGSEFCEANRCVPECASDEDCGPGEDCVFGQCEDAFVCDFASDCQPGHICLNNICTPFPCGETLGPECNGFCEVGECVPIGNGSCFCDESGSASGFAAPLGVLPGFAYGVAPDASFSPETTAPGVSVEQRLAFDVTVGELETFNARVAYPDGFGFAGFLGLGPPGTQVGSFGFDFDHDGTVDVEIPIRSLRGDLAYADVTRNGVFVHGGDTLIEHDAGSQVLTATLPAGGDLDTSTLFGRSDARRHVVLAAGLLVSPADEGTYAVEGCFTSVDPDTDGPDDGQGDPPLSFCESFDVVVEADGKVELCHKPRRRGRRVLHLPAPAVPAHLAHGDVLGPCPPPPDEDEPPGRGPKN